MQHGRYTVIRKLAEGGMAEIFLAKQHGSQGFEKPVVLKRIHAALYADEQFRNMLIDEAHVSMGLSHNNIVQVLDLGQAGGRYFLVLELVDGWDLGGVLRRAGDANLPLPPDLALYVVAQVCRALGYAHAKTNAEGKPLGIVHRDVSPQNVLISEQGEVKLADFGIAKARRKRENTEAGVVKGKIAFMSPEQALGQELDARSDLYSLGTLLYLLALGRRPFDGATDLETLLRVQNGEFTPPTEEEYAKLPAIVALLDRAMQFDRELRYHSADEMLADVESVLRSAFGSPGQTEFKHWLTDLGRIDGELPIGRTPRGAVTHTLTAEAQFVTGASLVLGDDGIEDTMLHTPTKPERSAVRPTGAAEANATDLSIGSEWMDDETPRAIRSTQPSRVATTGIMLAILVAMSAVAAGVSLYNGQATTEVPDSSAIAAQPAAPDALAATAQAEEPAAKTSPPVSAEAGKATAPAAGEAAPSGVSPQATGDSSQTAEQLNREVLRKRALLTGSPTKVPPPAPDPVTQPARPPAAAPVDPPSPGPTPSPVEPSLVPTSPPAPELVPEPVRGNEPTFSPPTPEPEHREPPAPPPSSVSPAAPLPGPQSALPETSPSFSPEAVPQQK